MHINANTYIAICTRERTTIYTEIENKCKNAWTNSEAFET